MADESKSLDVATTGGDEVGGDSKEIISNEFTNFRGLPSIIEFYRKVIPNEDDQVILIDLLRSKQYDLLKEYYEKCAKKTEDVSYIKIYGVLTHIHLRTFVNFVGNPDVAKIVLNCRNTTSITLEQNGDADVFNCSQVKHQNIARGATVPDATEYSVDNTVNDASVKIKWTHNGNNVKLLLKWEVAHQRWTFYDERMIVNGPIKLRIRNIGKGAVNGITTWFMTLKDDNNAE